MIFFYPVIIYLFMMAIAVFLLERLFRHTVPGIVRTLMIAFVFACVVLVHLRFIEEILTLMMIIPRGSLLHVVGNICLALAGAMGIVAAIYIYSGKHPRAMYFLGLVGVVPFIGDLLAGIVWLAIPFIFWKSVRSLRDPKVEIKMQTLFIGSLGGAVFIFITSLMSVFGTQVILLQTIGPMSVALFVYAGLHVHRDIEHEFAFAPVRRFFTRAMLLIFLIAIVPLCPFECQYIGSLVNFVVPAAIILSVVFISILVGHFSSTSIRTFLVLMIFGLLPNAAIYLFSDGIPPGSPLALGLRLVSRTAIVLASLFILKQYLRWGFQIVQSMVMFVTAISSAAIAFALIYIFEPAPGLTRIADFDLLRFAILILDGVILLALPPVLVNYRYGTMKVTWAIFTIGIFLEVLRDFPPPTLYEKDFLSVLSYSFLALAFGTLWRYTNAMVKDVYRLSSSFE